MKYVVVKIDGDTVILKDLFQSQTIEVSTFFINGNTQQKCEPGDILSYDSNTRRFVKDEVASEIYKSSFIDTFDPKRHNMRNYKLVVLLGSATNNEGLINGQSREGQCIFIPFIESEKSDVDNRKLHHSIYFYYGLKKFLFGSGINQLTELLDAQYDPEMPSEKFPSKILSLGHGVFYEVTFDKTLRMIFQTPSSIADIQKEHLERIVDSLIKDDACILSIEYLNSNGNINIYYAENCKDEFPPKEFMETLNAAISNIEDTHNITVDTI